jgi:alpha-galactosidase
MKKWLWLTILTICFNGISYGVSATEGEFKKRDLWVQAKFEGKSPEKATEFEGKPESVTKAQIFVLANYEEVEKNAHHGQPLKLGGKEYNHGLFCHAHSKLVVMLPEAAKSFTSLIGVDDAAGQGSVIFSVSLNNKVKFLSEVLRGGGKPVAVDVNLAGAKEFAIEASDGGDGISFDHADWVNARVIMADGREIWLADMEFLKREPAEQAANPFSFVYDGKPFTELISRFKLERSCKNLDPNRQQYIQKYTDTVTGLEVCCEGIKYLDFPTVEWVIYLKNTGKENTPVLENIQTLNLNLPCNIQDTFTLTDYQGGMSNALDYHPTQTVLVPNTEKSYVTLGGFPTASNLPFFKLERKEKGLIIGLGWPGMWAAKFKQDQGQNLNIVFGQERTHLRLYPGEEIRTPLMVLQFCQGSDHQRFQNVWRRWMMAHNMPHPGGKLPSPQLAASSSGQYAEMFNANEENQKMFIDRYLEEGIQFDYWWMDAGWYPNKGHDWQDLLGTWEVDKKRFPNGLRTISDYAHKNKIKIILWFEPERVVKDSWLFESHPEWLLGDGQSRFFNHGNPQANEWLTNHIDCILTDEGIDLYRQDFAVWARPFWEQEDQKNPDRQGMTEIKHVIGYLKYLDELQRRHPNMLIDICAAGGKRLELENLRRAVPLHRSDYVLESAGQQGMTIGMAQWIPYYGTPFNQFDVYSFRSCMCPHITACYDMRNKNQDFDAVRKYIKQWREVSPNYYGDFYPLTPHSLSNDMWIGWQFDRPEAGKGMLQMFCRAGTIYDSGLCRLKGLEPGNSYVFTDLDSAKATMLTGKEAMEKGLRITFASQPGAVLICYQKQ